MKRFGVVLGITVMAVVSMSLSAYAGGEEDSDGVVCTVLTFVEEQATSIANTTGASSNPDVQDALESIGDYRKEECGE